MSAVPQLGTLFYGGVVNGEQIWTQPGGPGTTVFPQQQPGEQVAMFVMPYCGHWTNNFVVNFDTNSGGTQSAFLLCPLCACVVRILTPASLYLDNNVNYILLP